MVFFFSLKFEPQPRLSAKETNKIICYDTIKWRTLPIEYHLAWIRGNAINFSLFNAHFSLTMTHTREHQSHPRDQTLTACATNGLFYNCCEVKADGNEPLVNYSPAKTTIFVSLLKNILPKGECSQGMLVLFSQKPS